MTKVLVTQSKLDTLAEIVGGKSNTNVPLTLDEMITAADSITSGGGGTPTLETITKTYTPSTSAVTDTITASAGYDGIEEVDVTVSAIPQAGYSSSVSYQFITENGQRKFDTWGQFNGVNTGYIFLEEYDEIDTPHRKFNAIATGTSVTPTESSQTIGGANYMMEGAVTVNPIPSSYVQPTSTVGATTYRASTSSQTIASGTYHSAQATIAPVSQTNLSADNIKSGTTVTISNGSSDLWSVTGTYTGGGTSKNVQVVQGTTRTNASALTAIGAELTVSKTGTYHVYWSGMRSNTSSSYTWATQLYVGGSAYGSENTTWTNNVQNNHLSNVSLTANQKIRVYGRNTRGTSYYIYAPTLVIVEA